MQKQGQTVHHNTGQYLDHLTQHRSSQLVAGLAPPSGTRCIVEERIQDCRPHLCWGRRCSNSRGQLEQNTRHVKRV